MAMFDEQNRTLTPKELAQSYADAHPNSRFVILAFNSKRNTKTNFSAGVEIYRFGGLYVPREIEAAIVKVFIGSEHMELDGLKTTKLDNEKRET